MGEDVAAQEFSLADRVRYRNKLADCVRTFDRMLETVPFDTSESTAGLEIEFSLVDDNDRPTLTNAEVLDAIANPAFQTELGRFNVETNIPPREFAGAGLALMEADVRASLDDAEAKASGIGSHMLMVGILPTLESSHLQREALSANPRYHMLEEELFALRGEDIVLDIRGEEHLSATADSIAPEAACTSTQLHLRVAPEDFAPSWNAAQAIAAIQVAVGANSPFFVGRHLWQETRLALFEQSIDTRSPEERHRGERTRVWFGDDWISSAQQLFDENLRYFEPLLPVLDDEDPVKELGAGRAPRLREMCLHNGTIYRWNRPVYAVVDQVPHLRIENRVLPSGPTVIDTMANFALYLGLVRALREAEEPIWDRMPFGMAKDNFTAAAVHGERARVTWPGIGETPVLDLLGRHLLQTAADGLGAWGVDGSVVDRLLGAIERRCLTGRTPAAWWVTRVRAREASGESRAQALQSVTGEYRLRMHSNEPVADW